MTRVECFTDFFSRRHGIAPGECPVPPTFPGQVSHYATLGLYRWFEVAAGPLG